MILYLLWSLILLGKAIVGCCRVLEQMAHQFQSSILSPSMCNTGRELSWPLASRCCPLPCVISLLRRVTPWRTVSKHAAAWNTEREEAFPLEMSGALDTVLTQDRIPDTRGNSAVRNLL